MREQFGDEIIPEEYDYEPTENASDEEAYTDEWEYEAWLEHEIARAEYEAELRAERLWWEREQAERRYYDDADELEYSAYKDNHVRQSRRSGVDEIDYEMAQYIDEQCDYCGWQGDFESFISQTARELMREAEREGISLDWEWAEAIAHALERDDD